MKGNLLWKGFLPIPIPLQTPKTQKRKLPLWDLEDIESWPNAESTTSYPESIFVPVREAKRPSCTILQNIKHPQIVISHLGSKCTPLWFQWSEKTNWTMTLLQAHPDSLAVSLHGANLQLRAHLIILWQYQNMTYILSVLRHHTSVTLFTLFNII